MALRLGPLTIPWGGGDAADDPYWDRFIHTAPRDPRNSVPAIIRDAPDGAVNPAKEPLHTPEITASHIKELARFMGADLVGIVRLDATHNADGERYPYGIVIVQRAEHDPREAAGLGGQTPEMNGLYVTFCLSAYIRELGWRATATTLPGAERLAVAAGLGQLDAAGRLVTPQYGDRVWVADVIRTELPLAADG